MNRDKVETLFMCPSCLRLSERALYGADGRMNARTGSRVERGTIVFRLTNLIVIPVPLFLKPQDKILLYLFGTGDYHIHWVF